MTLLLGSSPPVVNGLGSSFTTSPFSPAGGALLVAVLMCFDPGNRAPTNSSTPLTWTLRKADATGSAGVRIYTAPNFTDQTTTVTAQFANGQGALKVYAASGADLVNPVGATGANTSAVNNATVTAYNSTIDGSRCIAGALESTGSSGTPSSTDDEAAWNNSVGLVGMGITKADNTNGAGVPVTLNLDAAGTAAASWSWAAVEIKPALDPSRPFRVVNVGQAVRRGSIW